MTDGTVYAVASGKGGVGKTTTAVNLGAGFADAGRSVVVVDADLGMGNLGDMVEATPAGPTLHEVLAGEATLDDALSHVKPGFDVILGSDDLELFGRADPRGFREILSSLRDRYDIVLLDSGAGLSHDTALPLGLADEVLLVSTVEKAAVKNAKKTLDLARTLEATVTGIVLTRVGGGKEEVAPMEIATRLDLSLLGSVPEDSTVRRAAKAGEPLLDFDRDSPAAQAYLEIAYDIMGEPLPMGIGGDQDSAVSPETSVPSQAQETRAAEPPADETAPVEEGGERPAGIDADAEPDAEEAVAEGSSDAGIAETAPEAAREADSPPAAESESDGEEAEAEPELDIEEGTEEEEESRSFLSKITGGLLG